jgi:hypothetical protein
MCHQGLNGAMRIPALQILGILGPRHQIPNTHAGEVATPAYDTQTHRSDMAEPPSLIRKITDPDWDIHADTYVGGAASRAGHHARREEAEVKGDLDGPRHPGIVPPHLEDAIDKWRKKQQEEEEEEERKKKVEEEERKKKPDGSRPAGKRARPTGFVPAYVLEHIASNEQNPEAEREAAKGTLEQIRQVQHGADRVDET